MIKKRFFILMLVALLGGAIGGKCHAQIFIEDNEVISMTGKNNREIMDPIGSEKELNQLADRGTYAPIGSGVLVLCGLGGAYLLGQRRKKQ